MKMARCMLLLLGLPLLGIGQESAGSSTLFSADYIIPGIYTSLSEFLANNPSVRLPMEIALKKQRRFRKNDSHYLLKVYNGSKGKYKRYKE